MEAYMDQGPRFLFLPGVFLKDRTTTKCDRESSEEELIDSLAISDHNELLDALVGSEDTYDDVEDLSDMDVDDIAFTLTDAVEVENNNLELNNFKTLPTEDYDSIPRQFRSWDKYPKTTNLKCWGCHMNFNNAPWFVPISWDKKLISNEREDDVDVTDNTLLNSTLQYGEVKVFGVLGNFCSETCTQYYISNVHNSHIVNPDASTQMLRIVASMRYNKKITHIPKADPPTEMDCYCGSRGTPVLTYVQNNRAKLSDFESALKKCNMNSVMVFK